MHETVGVGAGGISCQMCNKIKSSWWPDTSIKECFKGLPRAFCGKFVSGFYAKCIEAHGTKLS